MYIDRIEISGNTKTRDKVIRRELELQEQQRFSGTKLRRSQERLRRLGFFEDVNITTRKADSEDRLDLIVDVREGNTGSFSAGAGISSGESFLFNVRLSEINLFGRGQRVVLNADFGRSAATSASSFTEPYFLDTPLTLGIDAFNWQLDFDEFTRGGTGGGIRTLYPFPALGLDVIRLGRSARSRCSTPASASSTASRTPRSATSAAAPPPSSAPRPDRASPARSSRASSATRATTCSTRPPARSRTSRSSSPASAATASFINAQSRARWYFPF